jgi:hypothetical protein
MRLVGENPDAMEVLDRRGKVIGRLRLPPEAAPPLGQRTAGLNGGCWIWPTIFMRFQPLPAPQAAAAFD